MLLSICLLLGKVFAISVIRGDSMEPVLYNGDMAVFFRLGEYQAGDVVILRVNGANYVKRIIAMDGDVVMIDIDKGEVFVNGERERYSEQSTFWRQVGLAFPTTVPADSVFVLGDNRQISKDSREFGSVDDSRLVGSLLYVLPLGRICRGIQSSAQQKA